MTWPIVPIESFFNHLDVGQVAKYEVLDSETLDLSKDLDHHPLLWVFLVVGSVEVCISGSDGYLLVIIRRCCQRFSLHAWSRVQS